VACDSATFPAGVFIGIAAHGGLRDHGRLCLSSPAEGDFLVLDSAGGSGGSGLLPVGRS
jgi:hypothetical protein